jgi:hypothetical protein
MGIRSDDLISVERESDGKGMGIRDWKLSLRISFETITHTVWDSDLCIYSYNIIVIHCTVCEASLCPHWI